MLMLMTTIPNGLPSGANTGAATRNVGTAAVSTVPLSSTSSTGETWISFLASLMVSRK